MATVIKKPTYKACANGGWACEIDGVKFTFFKPIAGIPFKGVDFKGDWWCKMYVAGKVFAARATTREEGIQMLLEGDCEEVS